MVKEAFEERKWREQMSREDAHRAQDKIHENAQKISEAAIQSGQLTIRTAAFVNGGAAVAVLAFIGGLIGQGKIELEQINTIAGSLMWFVYGVAMAVGSLGSSYIVNYCRRWEIDTQSSTDEPPYVVATQRSKRWKKRTRLFQLIALLAGILSLALFIWGMLDLQASIRLLKPVTPAAGVPSI